MTAAMQAFTFGDPVPMLDKRDIMTYFQSYWNGRWYTPPVPPAGLSKSFRANPHHASAIQLKANLLSMSFQPSKLMSRSTFYAWVQDFLVFGNAYLEVIKSRLNNTIELRHLPAKYVRMGKDGEVWLLEDYIRETKVENPVLALHMPDIDQEIYGVPEYLAALNSAWLNESATLFRRKYFLNGSHAGFILYMNDAAQEQEDIDNLREAMRNAKGPGNFRNLFLYSPGGKKDGVQIIPVSEVQAKDEFFNVKNVTRDDVLAAHRVPPQLLGIVPANAGGFGDFAKASDVFFQHEIVPLQYRLLEINDMLGQTVIQFQPTAIAA